LASRTCSQCLALARLDSALVDINAIKRYRDYVMAARKVRLTAQVLGTRPDGSYWPEPGTVVSVPEDEAENLVRAGVAEPVQRKPSKKAAAAAEDRSVLKRSSL
jgi:hypothetical protein